MCHSFEDILDGTRCDKAHNQCCFEGCGDKPTCKNVCDVEDCIHNMDVRAVEEALWVEFLDKNCCRADEETGNRLCDDGKYCDKCHGWEYRLWFDNWKKQAKQGYTFKRICKDLADAMRVHERYRDCTDEDCMDVAETFYNSPRSILRDMATDITEVEYQRYIVSKAHEISAIHDEDEGYCDTWDGGDIDKDIQEMADHYYGRHKCGCGGVGCYMCDDNIRGFKLDRI